MTFDCLPQPFVDREKNSAIAGAKGNDYQIDGRAKNSIVGIEWTHKKGRNFSLSTSFMLLYIEVETPELWTNEFDRFAFCAFQSIAINSGVLPLSIDHQH